VEDDEAGRLAGFRARFGRSFDAASTPSTATVTKAESVIEDPIETDPVKAAVERQVDVKSPSTQPLPGLARQKERVIQFEDEKNEFEEDDMNLLDMINSFGRQKAQQPKQPNKGKDEKK